MPTLTGGGKVLVSGANGYIASWIVQSLLERGYAVRGTVRSAQKAVHLTELFKSYGTRFEVVVVDDITREGAFDEAVKGVDGVAHTASPVILNATDPQELIAPAVRGTVGILESVLKNGLGIKRVIVLSSCASIAEAGKVKLFDESDWNELSIREVDEQGVNAIGITKYRASKTLAEKAAWDFYLKNKGKISWDLSILNPPFVFGPILNEIKTVEALNATSRLWYDAVLVDGAFSKEALAKTGSAWIDVRDLAEAHSLAFEKEAAGGERIIVTAGSYVWQDWIDAAHSLTPSPIPSHRLVIGTPDAGLTATPPVEYNNTKAARILGLKYRTKEELTLDTLTDFASRGW